MSKSRTQGNVYVSSVGTPFISFEVVREWS